MLTPYANMKMKFRVYGNNLKYIIYFNFKILF